MILMREKREIYEWRILRGLESGWKFEEGSIERV